MDKGSIYKSNGLVYVCQYVCLSTTNCFWDASSLVSGLEFGQKQKKKSHRTIKFADLRKCEVIIISINTKVIVYGVQIVLSEEIFVTILHLLQFEEKIVPV